MGGATGGVPRGPPTTGFAGAPEREEQEEVPWGHPLHDLQEHREDPQLKQDAQEEQQDFPGGHPPQHFEEHLKAQWEEEQGEFPGGHPPQHLQEELRGPRKATHYNARCT